MCRAICLSLIVSCWGLSLRADEQPVERRDRVNPPGERNADRANEIRETAQGIVDRNIKRIDSAHQMSQQIADCLLIHNQEEINLAKFALDHAQDERVKEFAQTMIKDHEAFGQKLHRFAGHGDLILGRTPTDQNRTTSIPTTTTLPQTNPPTTAEPGQKRPIDQENPALTVEGRRGNRVEVHASKVVNDSSTDWFRLEQTAARKCEQLTKESLGKKSGAEFDKAYMGCQVGMHIGVLAQLQAADEYVSGDLQSLLKETQETVQKHLTQAEDLCRDLASNQTVSRTK